MDDLDLSHLRARLDETVEAFRRAATRAIDVAASGTRDVMLRTEARHQATFALAAVGAAFKLVLKAATPDDPSI